MKLINSQLTSEWKPLRGTPEWPPYRADRAIYEDVVGKSIGDGNIDPELPTELIPKMGRHPTEQVQY